mmetsp:Transcript_94108/g.196353  ORF Transcript_94108/g.196353 Transcript_94108/m.196353 type:complete len:212 (-) Transcript_94108:140-775(-)
MPVVQTFGSVQPTFAVERMTLIAPMKLATAVRPSIEHKVRSTSRSNFSWSWAVFSSLIFLRRSMNSWRCENLLALRNLLLRKLFVELGSSVLGICNTPSAPAAIWSCLKLLLRPFFQVEKTDVFLGRSFVGGNKDLSSGEKSQLADMSVPSQIVSVIEAAILSTSEAHPSSGVTFAAQELMAIAMKEPTQISMTMASSTKIAHSEFALFSA